MTDKGRTILALVVAAVVTAVTLGFVVFQNSSKPASSAVVTSTTPEGWVLPELHDNGYVRLSDFSGKPLVVNFFASWCDSCRDEFPALLEVSQQYRGRVQFAGINSEETGDGYAMAQQFGVTWWPLARDINGANVSGLHDAVGAQGMPLTLFYDANGKLVDKHFGAIDKTQLLGLLQKDFGIG